MLSLLSFFGAFGVTFAAYLPDLSLGINAPSTVAQYSKPSIQVRIRNEGTLAVDQTNIPEKFLTCSRDLGNGKQIIIYKSKLLPQFTVQAGSSMSITILFSDLLTQAIGEKIIECHLNSDLIGGDSNQANNIRTSKISVIEASRFDIAMDRSISSIKDHLDAPEIKGGAEGINNFLMTKLMNVVVPLILVVGILIALLGFYKLLFSSDEKATGDGIKYVSFGVLGIVFIMSAKFITGIITDNLFNRGVLGFGDVQGWQLAQQIYEKLAFPFLKLAMYLILGVLFVILISRVITFLFGTDDDAKKKAGTIIGRNVIGMLVIIGAKQIVEAIYGKQQTVVRAITNLGEIGGPLLADRNIPLFFKVVNWAMGLSALAILLVIIFQAFSLLMKPDDPDQTKKLKNSLLYIFIGIVIIGVGYILTNVLIIN